MRIFDFKLNNQQTQPIDLDYIVSIGSIESKIDVHGAQHIKFDVFLRTNCVVPVRFDLDIVKYCAPGVAFAEFQYERQMLVNEWKSYRNDNI